MTPRDCEHQIESQDSPGDDDGLGWFPEEVRLLFAICADPRDLPLKDETRKIRDGAPITDAGTDTQIE